MLKYLDYVLSVIQTIDEVNAKRTLSDEINIYKEYWKKYNSDTSRNSLYNSVPELYDRHYFFLPTDETVTISWDIEQLYEVANSSIKSTYLSLIEFEKLTETDRINAYDELKRIDREVISLYPHTHTSILLINFKPTNNLIIIDGRHRYMEYKKLKPNELLPVYILDDEQCFSNIFLKNDFLSYIILHNIEVINNFLLGKESLSRIINLKRCIS